MKKVQNILALLLAILTLNVFGQGNKSDTLFFERDSVEGVKQSIFITSNPNAEFYDQISNFVFRVSDTPSYQESLKYLKENKQSLTKKAVIIPWVKWVALYQYENAFYAYYPCDFLFHYRASVNDSCFIDWTGEGPVANKIISTGKIDDHTFELSLTGIYDKDRKLIIHIIDEKKGIAVFEESKNDGNKIYYLMIAADKIKSVPIIINNCEFEKQTEFNFKEPDYAQLLKGK